MPYTMEDFQREAKREVLARLTLMERFEGITPEQLASQLTPEQRIKGLTPEQLRQLAKDMEDKDKGR